jgi:DNA-binding XRE family transcriptional regulator
MACHDVGTSGAVRYKLQLVSGRAAVSADDLDELAIQAAVGANIAHRRATLGMSQAHLASESGVNRPYLHGIEKGQKNPSLLVLVRLARALNTTASQLVRHVGG